MASRNAKKMEVADPSILDVIRALRHVVSPITGDLAYQLARLLHDGGLDSVGQWGNAYFRCPECGGGNDCDGSEQEEYTANGILAYAECRECDGPMKLEDLRLSEGWVNRI